MGADLMRYDKLVEGALRGVMAEALRCAAKKGLPGGHHFYVSFRTDHPGVRLSAELKASHPDEMTIVLQHQFWDLEVGDDSFKVTLGFDNVQQRLVIPFDSVTAFADPSVEFGLKFQSAEGAPGGGAKIEPLGQSAAAANPPARREPRPKEDGPGEVVALDAFRKKK